MERIKQILEDHPFRTIIISGWVLLALGFTIGFAFSEYVRVDRVQSDLKESEEKVKQQQSEIKRYKSIVGNKSEFDSLVVYDSNDWLSQGDKISLLGGQVSIEVDTIYSLGDVDYIVDAYGEKELQDVETTSSGRAMFNYDGKQYVINVKDYLEEDWEDSVKLSISEIKK